MKSRGNQPFAAFETERLSPWEGGETSISNASCKCLSFMARSYMSTPEMKAGAIVRAVQEW